MGVHSVKVGCMDAFCHSGGMDHVVETQSAHGVGHLAAVVEVEIEEVDALVLQVSAAAGLSYRHPYVHSLCESLIDDEAADESRGSGDEDV